MDFGKILNIIGASGNAAASTSTSIADIVGAANTSTDISGEIDLSGGRGFNLNTKTEVGLSTEMIIGIVAIIGILAFVFFNKSKKK